MKQNNNQAIACIEEYLQHLHQKCKSLEGEINRLKSSKCTKELPSLRANLKALTLQIKDVEKMPRFKIGSFIRNKQAYLGQVIAFDISESNPLVKVRLNDSDRSLKIYSPHNLVLVEESELRYQWDGGKISKLVRQVDKKECDNFEVLEKEKAIALQEVNRAKKIGQPQGIIDFYQQKVNYCIARRKQLEYLEAQETEKNKKVFEQQAFDFSNNPGLTEKQQKLLTKLGNNASAEKRIQTLKIAQIELHQDCQQREFISPEVVEEYVERYKENQPLPAVKVMFDGVKYWLYDGFHSIEAAVKAGLCEVRCEVEQGSFRDAVLASCGVNADHGLRRSRKTKRNAVMTLLSDPEWSQWSSREIARRCKVSHSFVNDLKEKVVQKVTGNVSSDNHKKYKDKYGNTNTMDISNIRKTSSDNTGQETEDKPPAEEARRKNLDIKTSSVGETPGARDVRDVRSETAKATGYDPKTIEQTQKSSNLEFFPNQLLQIELSDLNSASEKLKLLNHSYCKITAKTEIGNGYNVKVFNNIPGDSLGKTFVVKAEDLKPVKQATLTLTYEPEEFFALMSIYGSPESLLTELKRFTGGKMKNAY